MLDPLQHQIMEALDEAMIVAIPPSTMTKAYACVSEGTCRIEDYLRVASAKNPERLMDYVEDRWERLEAMRQSLADGSEDLVAAISDKGMDERIETIVREGRVHPTTMRDLTKEVVENRTDPKEWPMALQVKIDRAMKIRGAEMHVGLIADQGRKASGLRR